MRQFVKFGFVGFSGLIVNFVIAHALEKSTHLSHFADFAIGYMAGGISNYVLNRYWTFRSDRNALIEGAQFLLVSVISLGLGKLIFWLAGPFGEHHFSTTWLVATIAGVVVNFFLNKYWTFKHVA